MTARLELKRVKGKVACRPIQEELNDNPYIKAQVNSEPEILDSLYNKINQYINIISKKSISFNSFYKGAVTVEDIKTNLLDNEVVIGFLQKQGGDSIVGYLVVMDKRMKCPDYILVTNAPEQIKKLSNSYSTTYFLIDNDSIISKLTIDMNLTNCIIGYDLSVEHIMNREKKATVAFSEPIIQAVKKNNMVDYDLAYKEFERAVGLYNRKQYKEAIDAFNQCDSLMYLAKGENSNFLGHGKHWISSCYHKMGLDSIAKRYGQYYNLQPVDMKQTILSDSILDIADSLYDEDLKKEALEKYDEASKLEKKNVGRNYWYANTLSHCAEICNELELYERAIEYETEAMKIREKSPGMDHIDYYWSLDNLFKSYVGLGNLKDLANYGEVLIKYMEEHRETIGWEYNFYTLYTSFMAKIFADYNIQKSQYYCDKTIEAANTFYDDSYIYTELYHDIILTLSKIGNDSVAFRLCNHIIPVFEKEIKINDEINGFSDVLNIAANHYFNQGDFITACVYQERAINEIKEKDSVLYGTCLSNLALTYSEMGRIEEAIQLAERGVRLFEEDTINIERLDVYAPRLNCLAHCYSLLNRPKDALRIGKRCFDLLNKELGLENYQTLAAANNLAHYYNKLGYYDEVRELLFLVVEHAEKNIQKFGDILSSAYENLAMDWARIKGDSQTSLSFINKSYEIRKEMFGDNSLYTIQSLYNKGRCLLDAEEYTEGIDCIKNALYITKGLIGQNNLRYVDMMEVLTEIYEKAGYLNRAIVHEEERFALLKELIDENHISYIKALENLSELYFYSNDTLKLYNTILEESIKYREMIVSDFTNYTSLERANVVNGMGRFFDWLFPLVCYYKPQPAFCSELYNALLLRKGILLNSEIEFSRLIRESGDPILVSYYNDLLANKTLLNKQYQLPEQQRAYNIDSLKHIIYQIEDYLVSESKVYGDYTKRFRTNWKDVRDKLKDGELGVEFVEFYDTCAIQNRIYYALVINKYSDSPELVPLCVEQQILEVIRSDNHEGLYQLIWNPILQKSKNVNTLFFSPAGILNNLGIEYVDINEHENISDKYAIFRLSSTREIVEMQKTFCNSAALYGGLNYSVDTDVLLAQNVRLGIETNSSVMYRGLSDSLSVRNSFEPLYNTKTEIAEIEKALKKGNISASMYSERYGTEESFKALSGKGMNFIHLATHGMYIGASEAESRKKENNLSFIQLDDNDLGQIQEDKSLSRSFLVMSGGDMLPSHKEVPDNLEDGILTASEISKLDLRGLDLVVLSACQTALGDIDNEGVYGLQRGFKKAGANTILMSLDKVDDEATRILMVEFYQNLMNGKTKRQSLQEAQQYLRKVENGKYDDPKYWASFIMLDGLN